jgi:hypothetical protein
MNNTYDIAKAFERIEDMLVSSMKKNLTIHLTEEQLNQLSYSQWQVLQLDAMRQFRIENPTLFQKEFDEINQRVEEELKTTYNTSATSTENKILKKYVGKKTTLTKAEQNELYNLHQNKLQALINETTGGLKKAEHAILRTANDVYRKIIFDSQVYLNTGSGTLTEAIDMATKDFLSQGLNCIQYKNGAMVNITSYSEMALRTANTRAGLQGDAYMRDEWGEPLVMITYRSSACPKCVRYIGKVFYDDVWGTIPPTKKNKYPLLSTAIANGLYHPNCKDSHTTYFEGITEIRTMTKEEEQEAVRRYNLQQEQRYNERQIRKYKRLEQGSISEENIDKYGKLRKQWQKKNNEFVKANGDVLRRDYSREQVKITNGTTPPKITAKDKLTKYVNTYYKDTFGWKETSDWTTDEFGKTKQNLFDSMLKSVAKGKVDYSQFGTKSEVEELFKSKFPKSKIQLNLKTEDEIKEAFNNKLSTSKTTGTKKATATTTITNPVQVPAPAPAPAPRKKAWAFATREEVEDYFTLDKDYTMWRVGATPDELKRVREYTSNTYSYINDTLRGIGRITKSDLQDVKKYEDAINRLIDKFELKDDIVVSRKVDIDAFGFKKGSRDERIQEFLSKKEDFIGSIYNDKGFMSTSPLRKTWKGHGCDAEILITVPKGKGRGAYIAELSKYRDEYEFLLKSDSNLLITDVSVDQNGTILIHADLIV